MRGWIWSAAGAAMLWAAPAIAQDDVAGRWSVAFDYFGYPTIWDLTLQQDGTTLTGNLGGDTLEGSVEGERVRFVAKDPNGGSEDVTARLLDGKLSGEMIVIDGLEPARVPRRFAFTAGRLSELRRTGPLVHEFKPIEYHRLFSPRTPPVLRVNPGDTIRTTTIDAAGIDAAGVRRSAGGNPQTGPFYIEGAMPGDTLVVRIRKLRLNRDSAISTDGMVERGQDSRMALRVNGLGKTTHWILDRQKGIVRPAEPSARMKGYWVPVKPMLGGIGVATPMRAPAPGTGDSGFFGGNMDFNEVTEGATVYLPVLNPGALLYFGDGHALQGDGETTGDALETSMDVEVEVDLIRGKSANHVRVETPTHLATLGMEGSLDASFRAATSAMTTWLMSDYGLAASDVTQIIGTAAEYRVSAVPGRNAGMALKLPKARLATLAP